MIGVVVVAAFVIVSGSSQQTGTSAPVVDSAQSAPAGTPQITDERQLTIGEGAASNAASPAVDQSIWPYFLRMIIVLALVVLSIYGVFRLLKSVSRQKSMEDPFIKILASTQLGTGRWLHVVMLGTKAYLLGAADSGVSLVAEVDDKELVDALILRAQAAPDSARNDFASLVQALLKPKVKRADAAGEKSGTDFIERQRERLRKF